MTLVTAAASGQGSASASGQVWTDFPVGLVSGAATTSATLSLVVPVVETDTFDPTRAVWVAEVVRYNPNTSAEETFYYATRNTITHNGGSLGAAWSVTLIQPALATRTAFDDHTTQGRGRVAVGNVTIDNRFGALDKYAGYGVDGRRLRISLGNDAQDYPTDFRVILDATMESEVVGSMTSTLKLRDWQRAAAVPLQTETYAGDNVPPDGLEGESDLEGKPKPVVLGSPRNVEPVLVNAQKLIYQVHDGELSGINNVYDSGVPLRTAVTWVSQTSGFGSDTINGDVWCEAFGLWVAVGDAGKLYTSSDRVTWTSRTSGFGATNILAVGYGNGIAVAAGASGTLSYSTNGTTWTTATSSFGATSINAVGYSWTLDLFTIVGDAGKLATSPDGVTWTSHTSSFGATNIYAVAWGPGYWLAAGASAKLATSPDGATWTAQTGVIDLSLSMTLRGVVYGRDRWVVVADSTTRFTSTDGVSYTVRTGAQVGYAVSYGNGVFVSVGATGIGASIEMSPDGIIWSSLTPAGSAFTARCVANDGGIFVVAGTAGQLSSTTTPGLTFASFADLEDDTLAPAHGTYKVFFDADGSYIRLGSPPFGRVTCDPVQGATVADRTAGQFFTQVLERAGYASSPNLVTNPSALATGWSSDFGTISATNAVSTRSGYSFSRISNANNGNLYRAVTFTGDGQKVCSFLVAPDGASGFSHAGTYDGTTMAWTFRIKYTIASTWAVTATAEVGTLLSVRNVGDGIFLVTGLTASVTAAHTNYIIANHSTGSGAATLTSVLMSDVAVKNATDEDDWLGFDIVAMDDMHGCELGYYTSQGDRVMCADLLDRIAACAGASWFADQYGVIRFLRLESPAPNLVESPSSLNSSPWVGDGTYTNDYAVYDGFSFSRVQGNGSTNYRFQPVTLVTDSSKVFAFRAKSQSVGGQDVLLFYDSFVNMSRAGVQVTDHTDGTMTFTALYGSDLRVVRLPEGSYDVRIKSDPTIGGHTHSVYASDVLGMVGSGGITDWLVTDVRIYDELPAATLTFLDGTSGEILDLQPALSNDQNGGLPRTRSVVRYSQNFAPMSGPELAGSVSDADRILFGKEWLDAGTEEDATIVARHPLAVQRIDDSLLIDAADAMDEAERRQALFGETRRWFDVVVLYTADTMGIEIGDIIEVVSQRFLFGAGKWLLVLGIRPDAQSGRLVLQCWM